jgi:microprocessor complex subunit DGCR8
LEEANAVAKSASENSTEAQPTAPPEQPSSSKTEPMASTELVEPASSVLAAVENSSTVETELQQSSSEPMVETSSEGCKADKTLKPSEGSGEASNSQQPELSLKAKVESVEDHKRRSLRPSELREYCQRLFEFRTITVRRFRRWKDRRTHNVQMKKATRPVLLPTTKLITCPIPTDKDVPHAKRKEFVFNPAGKSHVCILHEYAQHTMRTHPHYVFQELENAETPYSAAVIINGIRYGVGYASSKKAAKLEAARITVGILIPEMCNILGDDKTHDLNDLSFFDDIKIRDPRVTELCIKAGQPTPYQILCECLKRNFGMGDTQVQMDVHRLKHQRSEFIMKVGKHEAKVICKNKREGKQLAAQAILHLMHPQLSTWGSLLRLYALSSELKEKKEEEHSVTELQTKAHPNREILSKLRLEMSKLYKAQDAVKMTVKGTLTFQGPDVQSNKLGGVSL